MAKDMDDLLTIAEASAAVDTGIQTIRKAANDGTLKVAKWTERAGKRSPLLVYRDDLEEWKSTRSGRRGFAAMQDHYDAVMDAITGALPKAQAEKVRDAMPFDEYKRLHYSAGK